MRGGLALWAVLFAAYAATLGLHVRGSERFTAAEAHNLLTAASIASDADLDLRDEYQSREWDDWYSGSLHPTAGLTNGRLQEAQGVGFPLLIAPAYALGGPTLVQLWLAAIAALGFVLAYALARRLVPQRWALGAVLVTGLSPAALATSTRVVPALAAATLLTGAVALVLDLRDRPRTKTVFWCAVLLAGLPWLGIKYLAPAAVAAVTLTRWLRNRQRGLASFLALEVMLTSAVVFITVNDRLYGGLTPYAARLHSESPTALHDSGDVVARAPRLLGLWLDREVGLLRWAPFLVLAFFAMWLFWRSRRDRVALALPEREDVEIAAALIAAVTGALLLVAAFAAPALHGAWLAQLELVPALPLLAALAGWGFQHAPRVGAVLAALTLTGGAWFLVAARVDDNAGIAPAHGALPWGGVERVLPRFKDH